jgi:hypothetical protein
MEGWWQHVRLKVVSYITDLVAAESVAAWYAVVLGREMGGTRIIFGG